jgi:NTE family protein
VRLPVPPVPSALRRAFPGGLFAVPDPEERLADLVPEAWPDGALWLVAVDIGSGRRVVLGREPAGERIATLRQAVLASCAIPGVYQPVRIGSRTLVDGGVHSTTNLDLAARFGCRVVIAVAPMAFDPHDPPLSPVRRLARNRPSAALTRELAGARAAGAEVLLVRPTADELRVHGGNAMRRDGNEAVTLAAHEATARLLETPPAQRVLARLR